LVATGNSPTPDTNNSMFDRSQVVIKLFCLGAQEYWENGFNRLDVLCITFGLCFYVFNGIAGHGALSPSIGITRNFALAIRFLRLLRLLTLFKVTRVAYTF
jgi:hypothetical protein